MKQSKNKIKFNCLYYNDELIKYHKYIASGGVMFSDDEGDFNSQLTMFKKGNFVEFFRNLWKNYFN